MVSGDLCVFDQVDPFPFTYPLKMNIIIIYFLACTQSLERIISRQNLHLCRITEMERSRDTETNGARGKIRKLYYDIKKVRDKARIKTLQER